MNSLPASAISMPTAFVIQEHLTLTSALISLPGKEEERMHLSPPWMASVQAQSTETRENWLSFAWVGHPAGAQARHFPSLERWEGRMLSTATSRNADVLLLQPLSRPFG